MLLAPSKETLLYYVNEDNGTPFTLDDIDFSTPQVVAGTWREGTVDGDTAIRLMGIGDYAGRQVVTYDRLDLASLAEFPYLSFGPGSAESTHEVLPQIRFFTGLNFSTDDVEDLPFLSEGEDVQCVLSAKVGSIGWRGSITITMASGGNLLQDLITETELPGLNYPTISDEDTYALVYLYGYDFSPLRDQLIDHDPGPLDEDLMGDLVDYLQSIDSGAGAALWNADPEEAEWSLAGAEVLYSGLNDPEETQTNPDYKYVMELELRADVTLPNGRFYLHFNDPFDPDDF